MVKIGDKVEVISNKSEHRFDIGEELTVFRIMPYGYDACNKQGDCCYIRHDEVSLITQNNTTIMKQMRQAVEVTAKDLCQANNTVTTLEVKLQLRRDYPYFYWDQSTVSKYMDSLAGDGIFQYTDNGTYRTYSMVKKPARKRAGRVTKITKVTGTPSTISRNNLTNYLQKTPNVEGVFLVSGNFVSVSDIRNQKKSLIGYVRQRPNLTGVQVNGVVVTIR